MAGWSSLGSIEDRRLAQSLLDGVPGTLAEIYDFYAPRLFDYCHALLRDQDQAADAVHDSLIAVHEHIAKLREPERLRCWIYAIVRNECLRLLADPDRPEQGRQAPEEADDTFLDAVERQRREESRQLVHGALLGLTSPEREALDLAARHDLSVEELSGVLGTSTQDATELVRGARDGLDGALSAALVARTARDDCPSVAALVEGQEWPPSPEVCQRLARHIESCPTCREHRRHGTDTTRMMQVLPTAAVPAELRVAVLSLADAPDRHERRTLIAHRAEPFNVWGWPTSLDPARLPDQGRTRGPRLLPAIGAAAGVLILVGGVFLLVDRSSEPRHTAPSPTLAAPSAPLPDSPTPSQSGDSPAPKTTSPTPTHITRRPSPALRHVRSRATASRTTAKPPTPTPGTLAVTGCRMEPRQNECQILITADGGPVTWSVAATDGVTASPRSGTLDKGQTATVTASRNDTCQDPGGSGSVSFSPTGTARVSWTCASRDPGTSP